MTETDYLESLLAPLRASFHAKRRDRIGTAEQIVRTVELYVKAVDISVTRELCKAHGLPAPPAADSPAALASELLRLVQSLPETKSNATTDVSPAQPTKLEAGDKASLLTTRTKVRTAEPRLDKRPRRLGASHEGSEQTESRWPKLTAAIERGPLVIVGGPPHLERLGGLALNATENFEWIDTTRQGTHAIGNLERRIRDHRIGGLVILEGLVQHRHTDPLISAARAVALPHSFGGKGGRAALLSALDDLESRSFTESKPSK